MCRYAADGTFEFPGLVVVTVRHMRTVCSLVQISSSHYEFVRLFFFYTDREAAVTQGLLITQFERAELFPQRALLVLTH